MAFYAVAEQAPGGGGGKWGGGQVGWGVWGGVEPVPNTDARSVLEIYNHPCRHPTYKPRPAERQNQI